MISKQTFDSYPEFGNSSTKTAPDSAKYSAGFQQSDVLPAEWMNWAWSHNSKGITDLNTGLSSVEDELNNLVTAGGETPSESDSQQVKKAVSYLINLVTGSLSSLTTSVKTTLVAAINSHLADTNNPHSVTGTQLSGPVPTANIADKAVTNDKLATGAVTLAKITAPTTKQLVQKTYTIVTAGNTEYANATYTISADITGVTELTDGLTIKLLITSAIQGSAAISELYLSISGIEGVLIKAMRNNGLVNVASHQMTAGADFDSEHPYRVCDAYTTLELVYSSTAGAFVVMGNPNVMSYISDTAGYTVKADGFVEQWGENGTSVSVLNFIILFTSIYYTPFCSLFTSNSSSSYDVIRFFNRTISTIKITAGTREYNSGGITSVPYFWRIQGY